MNRLLPLALALATCSGPREISRGEIEAQWKTMEQGPRSPAVATQSRSPGGLTADEAVSLALRSSQAMRAARLAVEEARGDAEQASSIRNPQARVQDVTRPTLAGDEEEWRVGARVYAPNPWEMRARIGAAEAATDAAEAELRDLEWDLACRVRMRHARAFVLAEQVRVAGDLVAAAKRHAEAAASSEQTGAATKIERATAEIERAKAERERHDVEGELEETLAELSSLTGIGRLSIEDLRGGLPARAALPPVAALEQAALRRPDIEAARAGHLEAAWKVSEATSQRIPWFDYVQGAHLQNPVGKQDMRNPWEFGLAIRIPIFDWHTGDVRAAEARKERREAELYDRVRRVVAEVRSAAAGYDRLRAAVETYEADEGPKMDEAVRGAREAVEAHQSEMLSLASIEFSLLRSRLRHLQDMEALVESLARLERAVGPEFGNVRP